MPEKAHYKASSMDFGFRAIGIVIHPVPILPGVSREHRRRLSGVSGLVRDYRVQSERGLDMTKEEQQMREVNSRKDASCDQILQKNEKAGLNSYSDHLYSTERAMSKFIGGR